MSQDESPGIDFALLGHPENYDHLSDLIARSRPDYKRGRMKRHRATLEKFFEWTPSYVSGAPLVARSPHGECVTGAVIVCPFLPDSTNHVAGIARAAAKTRAGCELARSLGARVAALGGLTSVVYGDRQARLAEEVGIALTSGNALTAACALEQLTVALDWMELPLEQHTVAIIGASGSIGRACAEVLANRAPRLILIGRNRLKLEAARAELSDSTEVFVSTSIHDAMAARIIVAATSAAQPLLRASALPHGTVVCDIGYPKSVDEDGGEPANVLVFHAGLAEMPFDLDIAHYTRMEGPRFVHGCFAEGMVLALSGRHENFSTYDRALTPDRLAEILELARTHGFRPAPLLGTLGRIEERHVAAVRA